ncbi:MAG: hypothetical protein AB1668_04795 [Nanoarchaeota archaeon]
MVKQDKIFDEFEVDFELRLNSREELRKKAVDKFLSERGGYWKDGVKHVTRYKYFVERLKDGRRVYLLRPTYLNKGIDFQVWVEQMNHDGDKRPSHKDIFNDIETKKKENPKQIPKLKEAIEKVWNCEEPDKVVKEYNLNFSEGFTIELLLKILKWLFIEQDITYWNYDGRGMLKMAIDEHFH